MNLIHAALYVASVASLSSADIDAAAGCFEDGTFHPNDWLHCQEINGNLFMYYTPLDDTIMLGLHFREGVTGWSSLAPSGNGGMKGASQLVVRKDDGTGEWVAEDRHSFDKVTPSMEERQDVQLLFAWQDDSTGETAWGVLVPVNSCDEPYDYELEDRTTLFIWAFGESHSFSYHGDNRGQFSANLFRPHPGKTTTDLSSSYESIDFLMANVSMVRGEEGMDPTNPFICTYFDLDVMGEVMNFTHNDKIHAVGYEPISTEGNEGYVHHMLLFSCLGDESLEGDTSFLGSLDQSGLEHNMVVPACTSMPRGCNNLVASYAKGGDPEISPPNVGWPIGEGQRWLVMQMHYFNPALDKGVYDSSGFRLYLTKELRPIDGGTYLFSSNLAHPPLPGGAEDVTMATVHLEPDCTQDWTGPLTVVEVGHHSHFMGTYQEIVVERDGVNLGPLRKEYRYDNYHQIEQPPRNKMRVLYPGDRLAATCHFDTTSVPSDSVVEIGEESTKEMCVPYFTYYPKQAVEFAVWAPPTVVASNLIGDYKWCSSPSTDDKFDNRCTEELFTDVPDFYKQKLFRLGYYVQSFDYPRLCNGGNETTAFRELLPICPECAETQSCSEEELLGWAQGVCESTCKEIGLTLFPDTTRTELYGTANLGCPTKLFDPPNLSEPRACLVKGSLPQTIKLAGAYFLSFSEEGDANENNHYTADGAFASTPSDGAIGSTWNLFLVVFA